MKVYQGNDLKEFNRIYRAAEELYHMIALKSGLSDSAFIILYSLFELGDGCLQKDICSISSISKQTINSAIRKLEQGGYIYLKQGKGREMHIYLTDSGKQLVSKKVGPVIQMENNVFSEMNPEERHAFLSLNIKYIELLKKNAEKLVFTTSEDLQ